MQERWKLVSHGRSSKRGSTVNNFRFLKNQATLFPILGFELCRQILTSGWPPLRYLFAKRDRCIRPHTRQTTVWHFVKNTLCTDIHCFFPYVIWKLWKIYLRVPSLKTCHQRSRPTICSGDRSVAPQGFMGLKYNKASTSSFSATQVAVSVIFRRNKEELMGRW